MRAYIYIYTTAFKAECSHLGADNGYRYKASPMLTVLFSVLR